MLYHAIEYEGNSVNVHHLRVDGGIIDPYRRPKFIFQQVRDRRIRVRYKHTISSSVQCI